MTNPNPSSGELGLMCGVGHVPGTQFGPLESTLISNLTSKGQPDLH